VTFNQNDYDVPYANDVGIGGDSNVNWDGMDDE